MYLVKCKCGCLFTLKEISGSKRKCPNCNEVFPLLSYFEIDDLQKMPSSAGFTVQLIPDSAKLSVTFEP